jgi:hypothetical protein
MQKRYRAAATALLLTATAGMAATGGAAEASGTHHHSRAAAKSLTITIKSKAHSLKVSDTKFRPGKTVFRVKNMDGKASKGLVQLLRLRKGYTLQDAFTDVPNALNGDPTAVQRVDKHIIFYGGMGAAGGRHKPAQKWAVNVNKAGTYYLVNLDSGNLVPLTVKGAKQRRALPARDGFINAVTSNNAAGNSFKAGKHNPVSGWMSTKNKAKEPHFVELDQVKKSTTNKDITKMFQGGPNVFVDHGATAGTGVISPGHTFLWSYNLKKAKYGVLCFWPSATDGMPHAVMGMHIVTHLG